VLILWQLDYYENGGVTRNQLHHISWFQCIYIAIATMSWIPLFDDLTASHERLL